MTELLTVLVALALAVGAFAWRTNRQNGTKNPSHRATFHHSLESEVRNAPFIVVFDVRWTVPTRTRWPHRRHSPLKNTTHEEIDQHVYATAAQVSPGASVLDLDAATATIQRAFDPAGFWLPGEHIWVVQVKLTAHAAPVSVARAESAAKASQELDSQRKSQELLLDQARHLVADVLPDPKLTRAIHYHRSNNLGELLDPRFDQVASRFSDKPWSQSNLIVADLINTFLFDLEPQYRRHLLEGLQTVFRHYNRDELAEAVGPHIEQPIPVSGIAIGHGATP